AGSYGSERRVQALKCLPLHRDMYYSAAMAPAGQKLLREVGRRVRALREGLGWTQRELASRAGLSVRFLAQLEHGEGNISLVRFAEVGAALGVDPAGLLREAPP